ncbi:NADH dehydrogenase [ubiquinone] complex I, assembly factor 7 [Daldinia childiae]|uniref:NADH dehydrogenase [ubiquinone] complex I, assembly factor 7 n=1 Tax=Daldinia childiae TaxID=326645 RepID=UPI001446B20F|nr:NADH dehydrogenase [ubiquinone] complex I, assembly factor 7 [Daldinia childiae]KAF3059830.1 NADH dehydrogenase [ubiquinone] complex I, assembly factor 7 [Daldinia childiae]
MRSNVLRTAQCGLRYLSRRPLSHGPKVAHQIYRGFAATPVTREERQWSTPLAKQLAEAINITGPIPLASYMRMCLTGDIGGYYTGAIEAGRDQFGRKGDFITSPEISQIFGELIGVWFVAEWMSQGRPKQGVELIEVGPGRGTLMDDMLRTIRNFKDMASSIDTIYMVEASVELRTAQKNLLCGKDAVMTESEIGWHSTSKYNGLPIVWTDSIKAIPQDSSKTPFIVAHEFFDALPIHAFQLVDLPPTQKPTTPESNNKTSSSDSAAAPNRQWREMVVSPTPKGTTHADLGTPQAERHDPVPEFQLTLSPSVTRHAQYLPESSPRYRALKSIPSALIEVCPDSSIYASDFATRIGGSSTSPKPRPSGAALILDYGPTDTIPANSLRGIRQHRRVSPFAAPGLVDLSADVDFGAIVEAATIASPGVECHGPVEQAYFLEAMGVQQRAEMLSRKLGAGPNADEKKKEIERSWKRLVDRGPSGMGKIYKVLAILPENEGRRRPVGFGGDVSP